MTLPKKFESPTQPTWEWGISCGFSLVLVGKVGKEIPELLWLEI